MPGLSAVFDKSGNLAGREDRLDAALGGLAHGPDYSVEIPLKEDHLHLCFSRHGGYPVRTIRKSGVLILVDGFIYQKTGRELEERLEKISGCFCEAGPDLMKRVEDFMLSTEGEYAVLLFDENAGRVLVFTDPLCRLPLYYCREGDLFSLSREPGFLLKLFGKREFDRRSLFEYLLFGYPLEQRTVFEGIRRLPGGAAVTVDCKNGGHRVEKMNIFDFEKKTEEGAGTGRHAERICGYLREACSQRADPDRRNVLALSGGLDSRAVAGCLKKNGTPFSAVTFCDYYGIVSPDVKYAGRIAQALNIDWKLYEVNRARGKECLELLSRLCGTNYLGLSFSVPLIRKIVADGGRDMVLFTGDGGDRVLRDIRPVGKIADTESLAHYIIERNSMIDIETVSRLTGEEKDGFVDRLTEYLEGYPESDPAMKYVRFIFTERCPGWHFQGEERNRSYLRPAAPFYSIKLFRYSMSLPGGLKKDFRLYREVLKRISPVLAGIKNPEWGFPITSARLPLYCLARRAYFSLPSGAGKMVERRMKRGRMACPYQDDSNFMRCLKEQMEKCGALSEYLSTDAIRASVGSMDKLGLDHLFTLTSVIEKIRCGRSSLKSYNDKELI